MHSNQVPQKTQRSHEENQERAYIAASRRNDRSLEARVQSAQMASKIHKRRTGKALHITEDIVARGEMYEEEDDRFLRSSWLSNGSNIRRSSEPATHLPSHVPASHFMTAEEKKWRENQINQAFAQAFPNAQQILSQPWSQNKGPARHYSDSFLEHNFQTIEPTQDARLFPVVSRPILSPDRGTQSPSPFALTFDSSRSVSPGSPTPPQMTSGSYEFNGLTLDTKMANSEDSKLGMIGPLQNGMTEMELYGDRIDPVDEFSLEPYIQESEWLSGEPVVPLSEPLIS